MLNGLLVLKHELCGHVTLKLHYFGFEAFHFKILH